VRLESVVEDRLRVVLRFDDDVRLGERAVDVAALVALGIVDEGAAADGLVRVEKRFAQLPFDLDERQGGAGAGMSVGDDRRHRGALILGLAGEHVELIRRQHGADPGCGGGGAELEPSDARVCVRTAQDGGVEHAGKLEIGGVDGLAPRAFPSRDTGRRASDRLQRSGGPLVEWILLDEDPLLGVLPLDLLLGSDQASDRIASSIFGYAPQRHRFPASS
jgi:hypothetical protein